MTAHARKPRAIDRTRDWLARTDAALKDGTAVVPLCMICKRPIGPIGGGPPQRMLPEDAEGWTCTDCSKCPRCEYLVGCRCEP